MPYKTISTCVIIYTRTMCDYRVICNQASSVSIFQSYEIFVCISTLYICKYLFDLFSPIFRVHSLYKLPYLRSSLFTMFAVKLYQFLSYTNNTLHCLGALWQSVMVLRLCLHASSSLFPRLALIKSVINVFYF